MAILTVHCSRLKALKSIVEKSTTKVFTLT